MMNTHEQMPPEDALEQRLRRHLAATYGAPPATDDLWQRLAGRLSERAPSDAPASPIDTSAGPAQPTPRPSRPFAFSTPAALPALAAVLLIAVLAAVILGPLRLGGGSPPDTATPPPLGIATPDRTAGPAVEVPLPTSAPGQNQVHILQPDELVPGLSFLDMRVFPNGEGWAIGHQLTGPSNDVSDVSVIYHLKDGRWSPAGQAYPGSVKLGTLSMISPDEGWVGGVIAGESTRPVLFHYAHGTWTSVTPPGDSPLPLWKLTMLSPREGWALTFNTAGTASILFHYQNGTWTPASASGMLLVTLAMVSPNEGWAAGTNGAIAHYQNGRWTRWPTASPGQAATLTMDSASDGWMSGFIPPADPNSGTPARPFTLHYDGHDWQPVSMPDLPPLPEGAPGLPPAPPTPTLNSAINSFSILSATDGWAVGDNHGAVGVIYHYTGGTWHLEHVAVNESLASIAMISPDEGWALGAKRIDINNDLAAVILHYSHGVWSIYKP